MSDYAVKDYTKDKRDNTHYCGVPSMHGEMVKEQYDMQPKYAEPGEADGKMRGAKRNVQAGP